MVHSSWGGPGVSRGNLTRITGIPGIPLYVRSGSPATIMQYVVNRLPSLKKPGAVPLSSSGGYNYRKIANSSKWSEHAWAMAIDVNAAQNPYKYGPLTTDFQADKVRAFLKELGGVVGWGGDYKNKKDAMHYSIISSKSAADALAAKLKSGGVAVAAPAYSVGAKGDKISSLELYLVRHVPGYRLKLDGVFDEGTKQDVLEFQKLAFTDAKEHDGIVGPATLQALETRPLNLPAAAPRKATDTLYPGETLLPGQMITSPNGKHVLILQTDGNLVLYADRKAVWAAHLRGTRFVMQTDGNAVLYLDAPGATPTPLSFPVWWTKTTAKGSRLVVQDDGNMVVYHDRSDPTWSFKK